VKMSAHCRNPLPSREILSGIRVLGSREFVASRTMAYVGTEPASGALYSDPAYVPRLPLRTLTSEELDNLCCREFGSVPGVCIAIVRAPAEIRHQLEPDLSLLESMTDDSGEAGFLKSVLTEAEKFAVSLRSSRARGRHRCLGVFKRPPGMLTTTRDAASGYIGLHVDSFFDAGLAERVLAPNRLCINLGNEPRHLVFVNLGLSKCSQMLRESGCCDADTEDPGSGIAGAFLAHFPDYPVLHLRIDPDEAYIAPTENIIHDSTTSCRRSADLFLTFLGYFSPDSHGLNQ
jgi:hypothetical protein